MAQGEQGMKTVMMLTVVMGFGMMAFATPPEISNVRASQREGTKLVDIYYDVADAAAERTASGRGL